MLSVIAAPARRSAGGRGRGLPDGARARAGRADVDEPAVRRAARHGVLGPAGSYPSFGAGQQASQIARGARAVKGPGSPWTAPVPVAADPGLTMVVLRRPGTAAPGDAAP